MTTQSSSRSRAAIVAHLREVLDSVPLQISYAVLFGSVARDEYTATSDVDVIVVSPYFEGIAGARRGRPLRDAWNYDQYGSVDFIAYTPAEYETARRRTGGLITTAETEGSALIGSFSDAI